MKASLRDLGRMDYKECWDLQRSLFDALVARKSSSPVPEKRTSAGNADAAIAGAGNAGAWNAETGTAEAPQTASGSGTGNIPETATVAEFGHRTGTPGATTSPAQAETEAGTVLLVEHPPVYTLGKSGHAENLLVSRERLEGLGARFYHIDRGGDITFHGPGQIVCYPILDLERIGLGLRDYIAALEESVIRTVACYGIRAGRIAGASGVWIAPKGCPPRKICAIGVRSSRYITMHGFALNVNTDLGWFAHINPCGFTDRGVASIQGETGRTVPMDDVKKLVVRFLSENLNVRIYK